MLLLFASFELDTNRCTVARDGRDLVLRPQCYDLLLFLLERAGTVVGKDEIVERVWRDVAVTDDSLTQCVSDLRQALGAEGARLIRTQPRRGYILDAEVVQQARAPAMRRARSAGKAGRIWVGGLAALAVLSGAVAWATVMLRTEVAVTPRVILTTGTTVHGQPIVYPGGTPELAAGILILAPGLASDWHSHPVPRFVYLLSGEVLIDYGPHGTQLLTAGTGIVEAVDIPHRGINLSDRTAEILYLAIGAEGVPTMLTAPEPVSDKPPS